MSDPRFQRTRENMQEFKNAGVAGKTVRNAFNAIIKNAKDGRLTSRLTKVMHAILKEDTTSARGERNVFKGNQLVLKGFDFNAGAIWLKTVLIPVIITIDRISGESKFTLEPYKPLDVIIAPQGATHYRFVAASTEIDFEKNEYITKTSYTDYYPYDEVEVNDVELLNNLTPNSELTIALAIGIEFYQEVNTVLYSLKNGSFNAAHLIEINLP